MNKWQQLHGRSMVIKVGTSSVVGERDFQFDVMKNLLLECQQRLAAGYVVTLISSWAVWAGRLLGSSWSDQLAASEWQVFLMETYRRLAREMGLRVGQSLLQQWRKSMPLSELLVEASREGVLMILNENDTMYLEELQALHWWADNDANVPVVVQLQQWQQLEVESVLFLTGTRWILDQDGNTVSHHGSYCADIGLLKYLPHITEEVSDRWRWGMMSKFNQADIVWWLGASQTHIADAQDGLACLNRKGISTLFKR